MDANGASRQRIETGLYASQVGFSLVELMVAMALGLLVLGAVFSVFILQNQTFSNQEELVAMQQNVRAGMDLMSREIGLAGYDPTGMNSDTNTSNNFVGTPVSTTQLQIRADLNANGSIDATSQENIIYAYDSANNWITRNIGSGAQTFVLNVQAFTFQYLDASGNVTATAANVRQIRITITGRTAKADPNYTANSGYRTFTLSEVISLRNFAL
jgi:type IV pilus assembly protein PilW